MATTHPLTDLSVLDAFAAKPFAPGYPTDHRTFNSPVDDLAGVVHACLSCVTSSLVVAMYSLTHAQLIADVMNVAQSGIPTMVVLDKSEADGEYERKDIAALLALRSSTPNLRLSVGTAEDGHDIMHRKIGVIDASVCITGSFNWTESACKEDNQLTVGIWPLDAALLTASIGSTYAWQIAHQPQP